MPQQQEPYTEDQAPGRADAGKRPYEKPSVKFVPLRLEERLMACLKQKACGPGPVRRFS